MLSIPEYQSIISNPHLWAETRAWFEARMKTAILCQSTHAMAERIKSRKDTPVFYNSQIEKIPNTLRGGKPGYQVPLVNMRRGGG